MLFDELGEAHQHFLPGAWRGVRPHAGLERSTSAAHGRVDVRGVTGSDLRDLDAGGRVDSREGLTAHRVGRLAIDPGARSDVEVRDERADVAGFGDLEFRHRRHEGLLASLVPVCGARWAIGDSIPVMRRLRAEPGGRSSGRAEELVRVRHTDTPHSAWARLVVPHAPQCR